MAISLASLRKSTALQPPRILMHGVAGVGKSTFAAKADAPVFIMTEDGLGNAPRRVGMTPEIYLMLGAKPEDVGTVINGFRAAFIKAVLTDSELAAIVGSNGDIRYEGCATGLARGRNMEAEMGLSFTFSYILRPDEL